VIVQLAGWMTAAVCVLVAAALLVWQHRRIAALKDEVGKAERRLALLGQIAPPLTQAASESVPQTCERIVERFSALVRAQTVLCFVAVDGRMELGAKSDSGYADFLRTGDVYEGDSILDWAQRNHCAAIVGPAPFPVRVDLPIVDMLGEPEGLRLDGPLVGSRDRVWALCIPMMQHRGYGLRPAIVGAVYAERSHDDPFSHEDILTASTIARFAGDALQRARFAEEVKRESEVDQLTQTLSAGTFRKRLREEVERRRGGSAHRDVALFFIDTDRFKLWNDTFGHAVGDTLLKKLADTFREVAATGGFAGRNGGDEFCIALLDRTKDDAIAVAEGLRERVERTDFMATPDGIPQPRIPITISIGVAHFPVDVPASADAPSDRLLEAADARMYEAKREGRNRVAYSRAHPLRTLT
jgi:diguanylate cyclase (GGDEF)-like protein